MSKTFEQWSADGYKIKKGSKSASRDDRGTPLFTKEQVEQKRHTSRAFSFRRIYGEQEQAEVEREYDWPGGPWPDDDIPF